MTFVGFDLHKRYITACALDETGQILAERRQLPTALEAVASVAHALVREPSARGGRGIRTVRPPMLCRPCLASACLALFVEQPDPSVADWPDNVDHTWWIT